MPTCDDPKSSKPKNTICKYNFADVESSNSGTEGPGQGPQGKADEKKMAEKLRKLVRFGPAYGEDTIANKNAKEAVWQRLEKKDKDSWLKSMNEIEKKVMDCYDDSIIQELKQKQKQKQKPEPGQYKNWKSEFRSMMARDGCFFLQLALHILGGRDLLKCPKDDPYFGRNHNPPSLIPDIFFIGNQIPNIVIQALMKHNFFRGVIQEGIEKGTWKRPDDGDLAKLALYETVVQPHLKEEEEKKKKKIIFLLRKQPPPKSPPSDVLEELRNLYLGSAPYNDPTRCEMKEFRDLEAGTEGADVPIPGAGELYKQGIKLVKGEVGITNIRFENWGYAAYLYVPPFSVDAHTEVLLTSLAKMEVQLNESEREITSYLRFMRDLARTYKDFKILERKGIIHVEKVELKGTMVHMLDTIVSAHNSNYTLNFRQIRRKIKDYGGPPWRLISFCLGLLTVVQTIFTVLSYCFPPRA